MLVTLLRRFALVRPNHGVPLILDEVHLETIWRELLLNTSEPPVGFGSGNVYINQVTFFHDVVS
jgi:hypothetical protein